jgi:hypothetical protein
VATKTQVSTKVNSPMYSFGSSDRMSYKKTYISKETARLMTGAATTAATTLSAEYGVAMSCLYLDAPVTSRCPLPTPRYPLPIAHRSLRVVRRVLHLDRRKATSLGKMVDSTRKSLPAWRIGTAKRCGGV